MVKQFASKRIVSGMNDPEKDPNPPLDIEEEQDP